MNQDIWANWLAAERIISDHHALVRSYGHQRIQC
jgi:hypothetical protein